MIMIRKVQKSDIYALADILNKKEVRKFLYLDDGKKISYKDQDRWFANERFENSLMLVAFVNKIIAGAIRLEFYSKKKTANRAKFGMYVDSVFWNKGVASALIKRAEAELVKRKICRLEANDVVFSTNKRGLAFYKKMGFKIEGVARKALLFDGKRVDGFYLAKEVGAIV